MKQPALLLLPNLLDETASHELFLPKSVDQAVFSLDGLIAESEKGARYFLRRFTFPEGKTFREIPIQQLNEHTQEKQLNDLLKPILQGQCWGLLSDSGLPCLADPGASLILKARKAKIFITAYPGPSSLIYALMLSGLSAQHFTFHGYLPKEEGALIAQLQTIQLRSLKEGSTHLFIETPYRNRKLLTFLLKTLKEETLLSVAVDLTLSSQWVETGSIKEWKKASLPDIDKRPAVFVIRAKLS